MPFGVYMVLGLRCRWPRSRSAPSSNNGGFTLSNVRTATHGIYLHGFWQSTLSVITAVVPGISGC